MMDAAKTVMLQLPRKPKLSSRWSSALARQSTRLGCNFYHSSPFSQRISPIRTQIIIADPPAATCPVSIKRSTWGSKISSTSIPQSEASATKSTVSLTSSNHQPPLPIRIALVSTTTALATPSFPALGFLYWVLRITVPDAQMRKAMEGRWGTVLSFATWTLLPKLYHGTVASLILPFAVGNAIVAGGVYGCIDYMFGGPATNSELLNKIMKTPWILGSGIGATVGYVAPHHVYGPLMEHMYGLEGMTISVGYVMSLPYAAEVSVVTGAVAGMLLHPLLYYPMNGLPGLHWAYLSGLTLAFTSSALYYVYYGRENVSLPIPPGCFISGADMELVQSILRFNIVSREVETFSLQSGKFVGPVEKFLQGQRIAEQCRSYSKTGNAVFDDRLLAFVYSYWDINTTSKYPDHVVKIPSKPELQNKQESMALTDAFVSGLMDRRLHNSKAGSSSRNDSYTSFKSIVDKIDTLGSDTKTRRKHSTPLSLEKVCVALELLITIKRAPSSVKESIILDEITLVRDLEAFIRSRFPDLSLYKCNEEYHGVSIEGQLNSVGWEGPELSLALNSWDKLCQEELSRNHLIGSLMLCIVSIVGTLFAFYLG